MSILHKIKLSHDDKGILFRVTDIDAVFCISFNAYVNLYPVFLGTGKYILLSTNKKYALTFKAVLSKNNEEIGVGIYIKEKQAPENLFAYRFYGAEFKALKHMLKEEIQKIDNLHVKLNNINIVKQKDEFVIIYDEKQITLNKENIEDFKQNLVEFLASDLQRKRIFSIPIDKKQAKQMMGLF